MSDALVSNGIDGVTGQPLTPPLSPAQVTRLALGLPLDADHLTDLKTRNRRQEPDFGVAEHVKPTELASAGWAVVFPYNVDPKIVGALKELLDHRKAQAGPFYRECSGHEQGYRPGYTKRDFLKRNGAKAGLAADPKHLPYYLMIVASPDTIPFEFQYDLDIEYAVGRLWFETPEGRPDLDAFARYAAGVVAAEKAPPRPRRAVFFGTQHANDPATNLSAPYLIAPLVEQLREPGWQCTPVVGAVATKDRLAGLLGGDETPTLLFTATHGLGFPKTESRQLAHQGALLCQDWPDRSGRAPIKPDSYFSAEDVGAGASGLIAFHFACYGAGTPARNDFAHEPRATDYSAPRPMVARLPQRLLAGGALAIIGHIDRAWGCSFQEAGLPGGYVTTFRSTLERIMKGHPVGHAMEYFNQYHASQGSALGEELKRVQTFPGYQPDPFEMSALWTGDNDARNFVVLGDPAVRLKLEDVSTAV